MTLSPQQYEYARLAGAGLSNAEIGRRLGVKRDSAAEMIRRLCARLCVERRDLAAVALRARVQHRQGGRTSTQGFERGDPVVVTGGRFARKRGVYVASANSAQVMVAIGGGTFALRRRFVQREAA